MRSSWRLYLDECVDRRATAALQREGIDATSAHSTSQWSASDDSQLAFAAGESRTLVTHDADFIAESAALLATGGHHSGVLLVADRQDLRWLLRAILYSLECWSHDDLRDQVRWVLPPPADYRR